jgi:hypothetical protein
MPVTAADIVWYKSVVVTDTGTNGGRMSSTVIPSAVKNALFPDVQEAERTAGIIRYRKVFIKNDNAAALAALSPRLFWENFTGGGDAFTFFPATQTDVQSTLTGSERQYGCGKLNASVSAGATSITVLTESAALNYLRNGDTIRISDRATINAVGNAEYVVISGVPSYSGDVATIALATPLVSPYAAAATRVASIYAPSSIVASSPPVSKFSAAGTFNDALPGIILDNRGVVYQNWTLTFTSSTAFGVSGDVLGSVGTGTITVDFAPTNTFFGVPYFTIDKDAFGGTFAPGDTILFTTNPASVPLWYRETVPAGTVAVSNNQATVGLDFETP